MLGLWKLWAQMNLEVRDEEFFPTEQVTAGPLTTILSQVLIPISMISSFFWLKERYNVIQVESALSVLGGVLIALIPQVSTAFF